MLLGGLHPGRRKRKWGEGGSLIYGLVSSVERGPVGGHGVKSVVLIRGFGYANQTFVS